ncbi:MULTISPECIES: hypothetical protein [unclassified Microcoleus]
MLDRFDKKQRLNAVAFIKHELKIGQNLSEIQPVNNLSDENL